MGKVVHRCASETEASPSFDPAQSRELEDRCPTQWGSPEDSSQVEEAASVAGRKTGPAPNSTVLSFEREAIVVAFRRHILLPLDECHYALQAMIP